MYVKFVKFRIIGELFNKKSLTLNVLLEFIKDVPNRLTESSIENICYFLKIIGAEIEKVIYINHKLLHIFYYLKFFFK